MALAALTRREPGSRGEFDRAIHGLERVDAFFLTPDLLGIAAEAECRAGDLPAATEHGGKALDNAETAGRPLEAACARALLACMAARRAAVDEAMTHLQAGPTDDGKLPRHVVALRCEARRLVDARRRNNRRQNNHGRTTKGATLAVIMVEERFDPPIDLSQGSPLHHRPDAA